MPRRSTKGGRVDVRHLEGCLRVGRGIPCAMREVRDANFEVIVCDQSPHELFDGLPPPIPPPYRRGASARRAWWRCARFVNDGRHGWWRSNRGEPLCRGEAAPPRAQRHEEWPTTSSTHGLDFPARARRHATRARGYARPVGGLAWYENGPAFDVLDSSGRTRVGRTGRWANRC